MNLMAALFFNLVQKPEELPPVGRASKMPASSWAGPPRCARRRVPSRTRQDQKRNLMSGCNRAEPKARRPAQDRWQS